MFKRILVAAALAGFFVGGVRAAEAPCDMLVGAGTAQPDLSRVRWPAAGTVCIRPGTYDRMLVLFNVQRSAGAPLVVRAQDAGDAPRLLRGVLVRQSAHVTVRGVDAANMGGYAAVLVDQGSHHVTIEKVRAHDASFGIALGSAAQSDGLGGPAGVGNVVQDNRVGTQIRHSGIAVQNGSGGAVPASDPHRPYATAILRNVVQDNGGHGISIDNSKAVKVVANWVDDNGYNGGGFSGIHFFASSDNGACKGHLIRHNRIANSRMKNLDLTATDGNGILLDHFCDSNDVSFNVVQGNQGTGISVFASAHNRIYHNTVVGNTLQPYRTSLFPPAWNNIGEIVIASCAHVNPATGRSDCVDGQVHPGRAHGNRVFNNIAHAIVDGSPAIHVMPTASAAPLDNRIGPNLYWTGANASDSPNANWPPLIVGTPTTQFSTAAIDSRTQSSGNLVERPAYVQFPTWRKSPVGSLRLTHKPARTGQAMTEAVPDIGGSPPTANASFFGAYYCSAAAAGAPCAAP